MTMGPPLLCGHCGRPIASLNDKDRLVYVGQTPYHYVCTQPPTNFSVKVQEPPPWPLQGAPRNLYYD